MKSIFVEQFCKLTWNVWEEGLRSLIEGSNRYTNEGTMLLFCMMDVCGGLKKRAFVEYLKETNISLWLCF